MKRYEPPAPLPVEAPHAGNGNEKKRSRIDLDQLRRLRTELQNLQDVLKTVEEGRVRLDTCNAYIVKTVHDVNTLVKSIEDDESRAIHYSDNMRRILNIWEQMQDSPLLNCKPGAILEAQEQTHALAIFDGQMKEIIFEIGFMTIPDRLNRWLERTTPGHYIPFHDVFENEMPDYGERVKLLNMIAWAPKTLAVNGGIVEPETGLVYCYESKPNKRKIGYWILAIVILVLTAAIAGLAYIPVEGWSLSPENLSSLLFGWAAVIGGTLVHLGLSAARKQQQSSRSAILAFNDIPLLISAKFGQIMLKMLLCFIGFAGLVFAAGIENAMPLNAFFVGYSLDSFIGILTSSLEQKGSAQLATLKQQLGITEKA